MNILNDIVADYTLEAFSWIVELFPVARTIFFLLASIELAWSLASWSLSGAPSFWAQVAKRMLTLSFLYALLAFYTSYVPEIVAGLGALGAQAGQAFELDPSGILDQGVSLALELFWASISLDFFNPVSMVLRMVPIYVILFAYGLMAVQVLRVLIEQVVIWGTGVIWLAFSASRWTWSLSDALIRYSVQVGVRLFMVSLLVGTGRVFASRWAQQIQQLGGILDFRDWVQVIVGAVAFSIVVWTVPERVAGTLAGSFTVGNPYASD